MRHLASPLRFLKGDNLRHWLQRRDLIGEQRLHIFGGPARASNLYLYSQQQGCGSGSESGPFWSDPEPIGTLAM